MGQRIVNDHGQKSKLIDFSTKINILTVYIMLFAESEKTNEDKD